MILIIILWIVSYSLITDVKSAVCDNHILRQSLAFPGTIESLLVRFYWAVLDDYLIKYCFNRFHEDLLDLSHCKDV